MARVRVNGGYINYQVTGEGKPVVMLRGLGRTVRHWLGYDRYLAKHFQVVTLDNRGLGRSKCRVPWDVTISDMAEDVVRVLDHLEIDSAHFMGISLGGMIALALGLNHPDRCRSLTIINSSIGGELTLRLTVPALMKLARNLRDPHKINEVLADLLVSPDLPEKRRTKMMAEWVTIIEQEGMPYLTTLKQLAAAARFKVAADLRAMRVPTLVVYGTDDRFVPIVNSLMIHRSIPGAKMVKIDGGGHELMTDRPAELLLEIRKFIAEVEGASHVIVPDPVEPMDLEPEAERVLN